MIAPPEGGYAEDRDLSKYIREAFLHDFREKVQGLGVDVQALNIEKLEFDKVVGDLLRQVSDFFFISS
jgi:membrane protease subunit (stomatin/prohibitin family)